MMTVQMIEKNGKKVLEMIFEGKNYSTIEHAAVYGLNSKPYIKRLRQKMYLTKEMLSGDRVAV